MVDIPEDVMDVIERRAREFFDVRMIAQMAGLTGEETRDIEKAAHILAERSGYSAEEAAQALINMIQAIGGNLELAMCAAIDENQEPGEPLDVPTARDRKETREKRRAVERATASRFRQYKTRERAWGVWKRTGQRRREWKGADRL